MDRGRPTRPHLGRVGRAVAAVATLIAVVGLLAGCGASSPEGDDTATTVTTPVAAATTVATPAPAGPAPTSELAERVVPAGSTATLPPVSFGPQPTALRYDGIGADAPIVDVGVAANGDMQIPGADEVGWYRYGPTPGDDGSAVLAAHVAWNGHDGVFRRLTAAGPGDRFVVSYDDGSEREFEVVELRQFDKDELPTTELFAPEGTPRVVLITCGGSFNRQLRSYDDNIVAYAVPV